MTETAAANSMPLYYKEPIVLDLVQHREMTVATSPTGFAYAAESQTVMLNADEFYDACREYPIIFAPAEDGTVKPLALLGVQAGENLFVDADGAWKGTYIPAYVRRYPFILADNGTNEFPICIDQKFDGLTIEGGQRIFTEEGELTDYCRHVQTFIQNFQSQLAPSAQFAAKLTELALLTPVDANIQLGDGRTFLLQGLLVVDENRLARLGDVVVLELFRSGYLGLIYAHMASVKNIARLHDMKAARGN